MLEREIEAYAVKQARRLGIYFRKWSSPSQRGVPDRIAICGGRVLFIEFKAGGGRLTGRQKREHSLIREAGGEVATVYSCAQVDRIFSLLTDNR